MAFAFERPLSWKVFGALAACWISQLIQPVDAQASSSKEGLIYVSSDTSSEDDKPFTSSAGGLTWYYNYAFEPTDFGDGSSSDLSFVPMLFSDYAGADSFADNIRQMNPRPSHVLAFNEPDMCSDGGSCLDTDRAAELWLSQMAPLQAEGILVGSPAVSGQQSGLDWLQAFFTACRAQNSTQGCVPDFMAVHYYGDVQGLAAWIGQVSAAYLNFTLSNVTDDAHPQSVNARGGVWVTEYTLPNADLSTTQQFYNDSTSFLDGLYYVQRYAWFGAFRSQTSNVGPNAAFLDANGALTDIGSWYVGGGPTGNIPTSSSSSSSSSSSDGDSGSQGVAASLGADVKLVTTFTTIFALCYFLIM